MIVVLVFGLRFAFIMSMFIMAMRVEFADKFFSVNRYVKMSVQLLFRFDRFRQLAACDNES